MAERNWRLRLHDVLDAIVAIREDTADASRQEFIGDRRRAQLVERNLEIIGEAIRHVPAEILAHEPKVPWSDVIGMRNFIAHGYFVVDREMLWRSVADELVAVEQACRRLLARPE